jgi:hypothetical protein
MDGSAGLFDDPSHASGYATDEGANASPPFIERVRSWPGWNGAGGTPAGRCAFYAAGRWRCLTALGSIGHLVVSDVAFGRPVGDRPFR